MDFKMTMNNLSDANEKLLALIETNVSSRKPEDKISTLYWTIINNTILNSISKYQKKIKLTDDDAKQHHGSEIAFVDCYYKYANKNIAKALCVLRQYMPYSKAKYFVSNPSQLRSDTLFHLVYAFKYELNSNFHSYFDLTKS